MHVIERTVQQGGGWWTCLETGRKYLTAAQAFNDLTGDAQSMIRPRGIHGAAAVKIEWRPSTEAGRLIVESFK